MATGLTLDQYAAKLDRQAERVNADPGKFLRAAALLIEGDLKQFMTEGRSPDGTPYKALAHPRPNGGDKPLLDTGLLRASLGGGPSHVRRIDGRTLVVGTNLNYAATHQHGATVTPKKGKYLAIPLTKTAKAAKSPRNYGGDLLGIFGKSGGVLVDKATDVAQYALTKSVTIPARPFVGMAKETLDKLKALAAAMYGPKGGG